MDRVYFVCTDCAGVLIKAGAVRSEKPEHKEIGMVACETHTTEHRPAATSVFEGTPEAIEKLFAPPEQATAAAGPLGEHDRETSPGDVDPNAPTAPAGFEATAAGVLVPKEAERLPTSAGPLTILAADIYVAVLRYEGRTVVDDELSIERAVASARKLLLMTKGA